MGIDLTTIHLLTTEVNSSILSCVALTTCLQYIFQYEHCLTFFLPITYFLFLLNQFLHRALLFLVIVYILVDFGLTYRSFGIISSLYKIHSTVVNISSLALGH